MNDCPTAEHRANFIILFRITGLSVQNLMLGRISPRPSAKTKAVIPMYRLVQNMKSYGLATTPRAFDFCFKRPCTPPVIPSHVSDRAMNRMPRGDDAVADFFLPIETMHVPPMMAATERYSRIVYLAPPNRRDPIITGTILPDFAKVTTGKETPLARERDVNAFAHTCVAPLSANMS